MRTATFLDFTKCEAGVLLSTDVAARGLDFPSVTTIVQFDPPGEPSEYAGCLSMLSQRVCASAKKHMEADPIDSTADLSWRRLCERRRIHMWTT